MSSIKVNYFPEFGPFIATNSRIGVAEPTGEEAMAWSKFSQQQIAFIPRQAEKETGLRRWAEKSGSRCRRITAGARSKVG